MNPRMQQCPLNSKCWAQEELETVRAGADQQIQEAWEAAEKAMQETIETKVMASECQARVAKLEQELECADQYVAKECKQT